jgi:hypothetical protein
MDIVLSYPLPTNALVVVQVALNTMDQLNAQKKQIADIIDEVDEMNDGLKRADKLLRYHTRSWPPMH